MIRATIMPDTGCHLLFNTGLSLFFHRNDSKAGPTSMCVTAQTDPGT
jgi:hypothetical protein